MIDQVLGSANYELATKLLDASALRQEAIATNLANAETPGFKRVDLSPEFERQLAEYAARPGSVSVESLRPSIAVDPSILSAGPDGNNVELDRELLAMNRNALEYEFLTRYASDSLKRLQTAITGRAS